MGKLTIRQGLPVIDARDLGAKCDECPFVGSNPVPPSLATGEAQLVLLGESPGRDDVLVGEISVGETSETRLNPTLRSVGLKRSEVHITNAVLCQSTRDAKPAEWKQAARCCRPRLARELAGQDARVVFAMGEWAQFTMTGRAGIMKWMGHPLPGIVWKANGQAWKPLKRKPEPDETCHDFRRYGVLSSVHPSFTLPHRSPQWTPVFASFMERAVDLARFRYDGPAWPTILFNGPSGNATDEAILAALDELEETEKHLALDTETNSLDALTADVINVGISGAKLAVSIYWPEVTPALFERVRKLCANPVMRWDMWNAQYDVLIMEHRCGIPILGPVDDWMAAKSIYAARIPNNLGISAAIEFRLDRWKSEFKAGAKDGGSGAEKFVRADPTKRAIYNAKDCFGTYLFHDAAPARLRDYPKGEALYAQIRDLVTIATDMRRVGIGVDRERVKWHAERTVANRTTLLARLKEIAAGVGVPDYNPRSHPQRKKLYLDILGVSPVKRKGAVTFDEEALTTLCADRNPVVRDLARVSLELRSVDVDMKLIAFLGDRTEVHPSWWPGKAITKRWASSEPNMQNVRKREVDKSGKVTHPGQRDMFCARPGRMLWEIDMSQFESRIIAILSGDEQLLAWHNDTTYGPMGRDVHTLRAATMFGVDEKAVTKRQRNAMKQGGFCLQYGGSARKLYETLIVDFPEVTEAQCESFWRWFNSTHKSIAKWFEEGFARARNEDLVEEALSGMTFWCHGQIDENFIRNFRVQACAASHLNNRMPPIWRRLAVEAPGSRIISQVHDSLLIETPEGDARAVRIAKEELERPVELAGNVIVFPTEIKCGINYGEMKDWKEAV